MGVLCEWKGGSLLDQKKTGSFLRELRKEQEITQEQFAENLGVSARTVSRWETGSNMPDISLLADIADYYNVSIPEIIAGERKSDEMNEEVKEVAEAMSDYAGQEKERIVKEIRHLSIVGACALIGYGILTLSGLSGKNAVFGSITLYLRTLIFVTVLLMPVYTTGLIGKMKRRNHTVNLPKPAVLVLSAAAAIAAAIVIKMLLSAAGLAL